MGSQEGVVKITGAVGDLSFYKSKDGFMVRRPSGVNGDRIKNAPEFARTRENMREFSSAGQAGKLLRKAFQSLLRNAADGRMASRLTKQMMAVLKADTTSARGERNVVAGEPGLLQGFEFNSDSHLASVLTAQYTTAIDRAAGKLSLIIANFVPFNEIVAPPGATHCRIIIGGAEIDFATGDVTNASAQSADLAIGEKTGAPLALEVAVTAASKHPLFLMVSVTFSQVVNGTAYPLQSGSFNALSMVKVDSPAKTATPPPTTP